MRPQLTQLMSERMKLALYIHSLDPKNDVKSIYNALQKMVYSDGGEQSHYAFIGEFAKKICEGPVEQDSVLKAGFVSLHEGCLFPNVLTRDDRDANRYRSSIWEIEGWTDRLISFKKSALEKVIKDMSDPEQQLLDELVSIDIMWGRDSEKLKQTFSNELKCAIKFKPLNGLSPEAIEKTMRSILSQAGNAAIAEVFLDDDSARLSLTHRNHFHGCPTDVVAEEAANVIKNIDFAKVSQEAVERMKASIMAQIQTKSGPESSVGV